MNHQRASAGIRVLRIASTAVLFAASAVLSGQMPPIVPDDQVPEVGADVSSAIVSGSGYDGFSGSTVRAVNDITVPNVVGDLGLSWGRKLTSSAPHLWSFTYPWRAERRPFHTSTVITYPDGSSRKFGGNPLTAGFKGREPGCHDRLETWPDSSIGAYGYRMILHLADGAKVHFSGFTDWSSGDEYLIDFIYLDYHDDRFGRRTNYTFDFPEWPLNLYHRRIRQITAPGGAWLKFDYNGNGDFLEKVTASDGQWVDYTWGGTPTSLTRESAGSALGFHGL